MKYLLLAVVAAACSDKHPLPASDANGAPDEAVGEDAPAPVDALVPDAQDTRIKVKVALTGAPTPDIAVFYHRPDGSVAVTTQTDASGIAASELDPGGYVTVVFADELSRRIVRSYVDVPPGTVIEIACGRGRP